MKLFYQSILPILIVGVFTFSCTKGDDAAPILSVSVSELSIPSKGIQSEITVISNEKWRISNSGSSWLQVSQVSGNSGTYMIELSAGVNSTGVTRTAVVTINSDNGQTRRVLCSQLDYEDLEENFANVSPKLITNNSNPLLDFMLTADPTAM